MKYSKYQNIKSYLKKGKSHAGRPLGSFVNGLPIRDYQKIQRLRGSLQRMRTDQLTELRSQLNNLGLTLLTLKEIESQLKLKKEVKHGNNKPTKRRAR